MAQSGGGGLDREEDDPQRRLTQFFPRVNVSVGPGGQSNITINTGTNYQQTYNHAPPSIPEGIALSLGLPPRDIRADQAAAASSAVNRAESASASSTRGRQYGSAEAHEAGVLGKRVREKKAAANHAHKRIHRTRSKGGYRGLFLVIK